MSNSPTTAAFLSPYQLGKVLSGVIPANPVKRPLWLQGFFGTIDTSIYPSINFDTQYVKKNVMGTFVEADSDTTPIVLPEFGTQEMYFAYAKEGLNSADYEELIERRLGQQFGSVDVLGNDAWQLQQKLMLAEERFENLFERTARDILFYGGYSAKSDSHRDRKYDFNRTVVSTGAELVNGIGGTTSLVPAANLTSNPVYRPWDYSSAGLSSYAAAAPYMPVITDPLNTGSSATGAKQWSNANITAGTATPVKDLITAYQTAKLRAGTDACVMSTDAYAFFNFDIETNYPSAADLTTNVILRSERDILPRIIDIQGLTFKRSWAVGNGEYIDIYVYDGIYQTRTTEYDPVTGSAIAPGTNVKYVPKGWMVLIPPAENGIKVYGRIKHPRANYAVLPRWLNFWEDPKTGKREWEYHTNFIMGTTEIMSTITWKVC